MAGLVKISTHHQSSSLLFPLSAPPPLFPSLSLSPDFVPIAFFSFFSFFLPMCPANHFSFLPLPLPPPKKGGGEFKKRKRGLENSLPYLILSSEKICSRAQTEYSVYRSFDHLAQFLDRANVRWSSFGELGQLGPIANLFSLSFSLFLPLPPSFLRSLVSLSTEEEEGFVIWSISE